MVNTQSNEINENQRLPAENETKCTLCQRTFRTNRGLLQHLNTCRRRYLEVNALQVNDAANLIEQDDDNVIEPVREKYYWKEIPASIFESDVNYAYEKIVYWRKNLFMVPTGGAGKRFINELTRLITSWTANSTIADISLKALHIMPALLLQKPSKNSKAKDHLISLERRLILWENGDLQELISEGTAIQDRLTSMIQPNDIAKISKKFKDLMQKGNVNGALKLLSNNMNNGVLPLNDETLNQLKMKHPDSQEVSNDVLLNGPIKDVHPIVYESIDEEKVLKAAMTTRGGSGPSGLDAEGWRRILTSNSFGTSSSDLRKAIAEFIKKLCIKKIPIDDTSLESFVACRLIPLNKNPGLRPIGVGEILRRIAGKVVMRIAKNDVTRAAGSLQVCAGQEAGAEAAIHAMYDIFNDDQTEAVLLVDAENAFNSINRNVMLHNISISCPIISTYVSNCYQLNARLFIIGGKEIISQEGTTQGDPTSMGTYALGLTPLLNFLNEFIILNEHGSKEVAFADDLTAAGKVEEIKAYWDILIDMGPKYGYHPKPSKSHLIVKEKYLELAKQTFCASEIKITISGQRHLGAAIGSGDYRSTYIKSMINTWNAELICLSKIAEIEPQAAYAAYVSGYKNKFSYFIRTIPNIHDQFQQIEDTITNKFLPAITGGYVMNDIERSLVSLPTRFGGLGISRVSDIAELEYKNSRKITSTLTTSIFKQEIAYTVDTNAIKQLKAEIKCEKESIHQLKLDDILLHLNTQQKRLNEIAREKGVSNWLNAYPIKEYGFDLTKEQFWDSINIRYGWPISNLPTTCACGTKFTFQHSMSCKMGGFVSIRHNSIRDLTANLLKETCNDVEVESKLQALTGERLQYRTAITGDEARLDVRARGFWQRGQQAFFDVRVFDPNANRYLNTNLQQCHVTNEKEKKRCYNERVLQVEHGTFTPLVFSIYGSMGRECAKFYSRLADMIAEKRNSQKSVVVNWIRTNFCFALLR